MNIAELIIEVGLVTEFLKKALDKIKVHVEGKASVILSIVVSLGVVLVAAIKTDTPIGFGLVPVLIQVAIGANAGFALLKVAGGKSAGPSF